MLALLSGICIVGHAADSGEIVLPEFEFPARSYTTFAETGIPYDEIIASFPEACEIKYENGRLYIEDIGAGKVEYFERLNHEWYEATLEDGFWTVFVSEEIYNEDWEFVMYASDGRWEVDYSRDGTRRIIDVYAKSDEGVDTDKLFRIYPEEGYGEQYVSVYYELSDELSVEDSYDKGFLTMQYVRWNVDDVSIYTRYDALQGTVEYIDVANYETEEYEYYFPGKGWTDDVAGEIPIDAPTGFEEATLESLLALTPTDMGCEHLFGESTCEIPATCVYCKRHSGKALGHEWVKEDVYNVCSVCQAVLYDAPTTVIQSYTSLPFPTLEETGIDIDEITSGVISKLTVRRETGKLYVPNIDGCWLSVQGEADVDQIDGWNVIETEGEDLEKLSLCFSWLTPSDTDEENEYYEELYYNASGELISYFCGDSLHYKDIGVDFINNRVVLEYAGAEYSEYSYRDSYVNGIFAEQNVVNYLYGIEVEYNPYHEASYACIFSLEDGEVYLTDKGWSLSPIDYVPTDAPEEYADKDMSYFIGICPTTVDFCLHSWEKGVLSKTCSECGKTVMLNDALVTVIIVAVAVIVCAVVVVFVIKKRKNAKK